MDLYVWWSPKEDVLPSIAVWLSFDVARLQINTEQVLLRPGTKGSEHCHLSSQEGGILSQRQEGGTAELMQEAPLP